MEESEKRRERLRAMRAEAARSENSNSIEASAMPGYLSNPLVEISAAVSAQEESRRTPRFDFYTDPMAAFSGNNRRNNTNDQISSHFLTPPVNNGSPMFRSSSPLPAGPGNAGITPVAHQFQSNYPPNPRMYQPQGFGHNPISGSPMGMSRPFNMHQGNMDPSGMSRPFNMHQGNMDPSIGPGSAASYYNFPSNQPRESRFPSPRFGPTGSPSFNAGQGRADWHNHSPNPALGCGGSPGPGRGGGRWHGSRGSPGSGRRGGRGPGSGGHHFTMDRPQGPERFYDKSMIEDPWKFLEPVVMDASFSSSNTPDSSKSWIPRYIGAKKAKVSDATNKSSSQPSLAEYLASSFDEAVNDESST
ncbi:hypothetical protein TIFTF001_009387 [Ficus carica]|uniref:Uncharacterized protein n=1 Tax=Ficus carica TaxID=3494 RepID=A0AA87ZTQ1_FICCA|nr:hypothetical protein TIFTF001_009387 [Ficus carica]